MRVQVVVLGDFGRSPRMQYHALSLATQANCEVDVIAYTGTPPQAALLSCPNIHFRLIRPPPKWTERLPRPLALVLKFVYMTLALFFMLCICPPARYLLLQAPPSMPSFVVCRLLCFVRRTNFVIDWHNFGYTLLALSLRPGHPFVRFAKWYEQFFGVSADANLCVTHAMKAELQRWGVKGPIHVLHDKPAAIFRPATISETDKLFKALRPVLSRPVGLDSESGGVKPAASPDGCTDFAIQLSKERAAAPDCCSIVTGRDDDLILTWQPQRPAIVVSSTSWTPDEDFSILLEAAVGYDKAVEESKAKSRLFGRYPPLLVLVTGKGPQKSMYEAKMRELNLKHVAFRTLWLSFDDYASLLGSADLGICLHTSSSGLDLPMKVVDMFGSQLPVAAMRYSTIHELVDEGTTGVLFDDAKQLTGALLELFRDFHSGSKMLMKLQEGVANMPNESWEKSWQRNALPVFHH